ncbi:serine/threonine protein kinase [Streptomyces sp. Je 1-79]|uniref:serine/threonine protein kinase n=1 Tax=Streptomyces sp. Je 1-79 TaxID=2943847 RepID=UPI0021A330F0|nr:serine/threonine protein kinase [Streptomyces sp. Je 1-79]MCT4355733.1 serine/threonine protein kinase [Streptomyces sp. Je 1-79]
MDDYAGRVLADRYRLPVPPQDAYELVETRAFDTYSGQEVLVHQVPLPEVIDAEVVDEDGTGYTPHRPASGRATRRPADPAVRRAVEAAQAAAQIPDHPRLDQVFDVFAEAGSLWIVSELVAARPLAALLAERPLSPYRAAEIGSDVLTALRALHAHGWTHRNITPRTVLVCDDGRVVLTGLAAGAAEEALCGYAPVPFAEEDEQGYGSDEEPAGTGAATGTAAGTGAATGVGTGEAAPAVGEPVARPELPAGGSAPATDVRAARAGAIAAYRAGARAAAHIGETGAAVPVQRRTPEPEPAPEALPETDPETDPEPAPGPAPEDPETGPHSAPEADPYGAYDPGPSGALPAFPTPPAPVPAQGLGPEPHWWSQTGDDEDEDDVDDEYPAPYRKGYGSEDGGPTRALLAGTWSDGPHASRDSSGPIPAGGGQALPALPAGYTPAPAPDPAPVHAPVPASGGWDGPAEAGPPASVYRGPATRLAAERARQARIAVVGAVTERWAPEQAGPVHENWRLAPPIGPATDLWALGALLYRAVQGHAPYPEDNAAELVQLVCAEPPAFAEECGPLRPVVESLLRQDPTERPDFEELRGWMRSLVRSAPEPEAGVGIVPLPSVDTARLPVVRRRGELVRRRRGGAAGGRHRHRKGKRHQDLPARDESQAVRHDPRQDRGQDHQRHDQRQGQRYDQRQEFAQERFHEELPQRAPRAPRPPRTPRGAGGGARSARSLGLTLLLLILLLLVGVVAYAVLFMPKDGADGGQPAARTGTPTSGPSSAASTGPGDRPSSKPSPRPGSVKTTPPAATPSGPPLAAGYGLRKDPEGFEVGVAKDWRRSPINDAGQVRYTGGDFTLIVVPGRDTVQANGSDPMAYQRTKEGELQPWRDSSWAGASGLRRIDVGQQAMAVGQFTWKDSTGRDVFVRNLALIEAGRYHVVQVIGPESERDKVSEIYDQAVKVYRATR